MLAKEKFIKVVSFIILNLIIFILTFIIVTEAFKEAFHSNPTANFAGVEGNIQAAASYKVAVDSSIIGRNSPLEASLAASLDACSNLQAERAGYRRVEAVPHTESGWRRLLPRLLSFATRSLTSLASTADICHSFPPELARLLLGFRTSQSRILSSIGRQDPR